jgi:acyl dehydratase
MAGPRLTEFKKLTLETSMAFVKPVYAGDRLTAHGVVKDRQNENGATRVVVEVWVENQHGEKTAVGHATGLVS